jgi:hypothetical protein
MNGCGKSDSPIVPVKSLNKGCGALWSAEKVEERGLTKGNLWPQQGEVLNFVEYLQAKAEKHERKDWSNLSLSSAMRGMEDEQTPYSLADLKESFS